MTTRAEVEELRRGGQLVVGQARAELQAFFATVDLTQPELVRDLLLDFVPALVREYGDVAATIAAEWYEQVRAGQVGGAYNAVTSAGVAEDAVTGGVRYAAGHLFTDNPLGTLALISGALQRYVSYSSRDTVARNAGRDPARPRFARVPTGAKTCAWCTLLASRGFVYLTRDTAGATEDYHDDCDCQAVAEFDKDAHHIDGYDPDALYDMYMAAREESGATTDGDIAAAMREMFPGQFTDSHVHKH